MQWNDLDYETQMKVLDRIGDLIFKEKDDAMQFAIAAAIVELEIWSNSPCKVIGDEPYVAQASDPNWEE